VTDLPARVRESALDLAEYPAVRIDRVYAQGKKVLTQDKMGRGQTMYTGAIINGLLKGEG
jgi:hypothetical protein